MSDPEDNSKSEGKGAETSSSLSIFSKIWGTPPLQDKDMHQKKLLNNTSTKSTSSLNQEVCASEENINSKKEIAGAQSSSSLIPIRTKLNKKHSIASISKEEAQPELNISSSSNSSIVSSSASTKLSQLAQKWDSESVTSLDSNGINKPLTSDTSNKPNSTLSEIGDISHNNNSSPNPKFSEEPLNNIEHPAIKETKSHGKRSSWWGFKTTPENDLPINTKKTPENSSLGPTFGNINNNSPSTDIADADKDISNHEDTVSEDKPETKKPPAIDPPASPWWASFGIGSGSSSLTPTPVFSESPQNSQESGSNSEIKENSRDASNFQNIDLTQEVQNNSPINASNQQASISNQKPKRPASLWQNFFSRNNDIDLPNQVPETVPQSNESAEETQSLTQVATLENVVLPKLNIASLYNSTNSTSLFRYTLDTLYYYAGIQTNPISNQGITTPAPSLKKVVIIGVHGWFPLKIYQKVVGEPTGTSIKFCSQMTKALQTYLSENFDVDIDIECITQIPLTFDGKIEARVKQLQSQLLSNSDWMTSLAEADDIFIVAHSQGTPVSIMLVDLLLHDKLLNPKTQRVSVLAMAGISHGPFSFLKENYIIKYFETDAARELFEFMSPTAAVVARYNESMGRVLQSGIKVCAIASMSDQVVPLYSGVMQGFSHPSIYRSVYIDGINYSSDFLTALIGFALLLRNHGFPDQGLIQHLSTIVAGSLYSGVPGHSTIYEEPKVYSTALQWHFALPRPTPELKIDSIDAHQALNPYFLPWLMRGILENSKINSNPHLVQELNELRHKFRIWKPTSKVLKELQFRLEPLKAQL